MKDGHFKGANGGSSRTRIAGIGFASSDNASAAPTAPANDAVELAGADAPSAALPPPPAGAPPTPAEPLSATVAPAQQQPSGEQAGAQATPAKRSRFSGMPPDGAAPAAPAASSRAAPVAVAGACGHGITAPAAPTKRSRFADAPPAASAPLPASASAQPPAGTAALQQPPQPQYHQVSQPVYIAAPASATSQPNRAATAPRPAHVDAPRGFVLSHDRVGGHEEYPSIMAPSVGRAPAEAPAPWMQKRIQVRLLAVIE